MEHLLDVLAHTWHGYPLFALACVGGLCLAGSFAFISWVVAGSLSRSHKQASEAWQRARYDSIVLAFDPGVRGLYAFRSEPGDVTPVIPFKQKESVH